MGYPWTVGIAIRVGDKGGLRQCCTQDVVAISNGLICIDGLALAEAICYQGADQTRQCYAEVQSCRIGRPWCCVSKDSSTGWVD